MRTATWPVRSLVLGLGLLLGLAVPSFAQQPAKALTTAQQAQLKERDRFSRESSGLEKEGKLTQAIAAAERMLVLERAVFGDVHPDVVGSLKRLARMHERLEDFGAAHKERREVLTLQTKLVGANAWQVTDARLDLQDVEALARLDAQARRDLKEAQQWMSKALASNKPGKYQEGAQCAEKALAIRLRLLGADHRQTAWSAAWAGFLWENAHVPGKARRHYEQALAIYKKVLGDNHPATATSLHNLGFLLQAQGDYAAARPYLEQALAIRKKVLGDNHPATATSLNSLGVLLQAQGDYAGARPYYEQAVTTRKKVLGDRHPQTAVSLNNLGLLLSEQGNYTAARPYLEQALAMYQQVLGDNHPQTATSLNNLGLLLKRQGDYAAARPYYEQALAIRKKLLGDNHPDLANSLNNLAALLFSQGDYAAARPYLEQALAIDKKVLGDHHPHTAAELDNLGILLHRLGDYAAARPYLEQALAICKKVRGDTHPDTAASLTSLGGLLSSQGDYAAARPYLEQALAIRQKVLGDNHPDTAQSLNNLGALLSNQGDFAAARPYLEQALGIHKKVLGDNHSDTATDLNNLGALLELQGDYAFARLNYEKALAIRKRVLGDNHPTTAVSLNNLGALLFSHGDYAAARPYFEQALVIRKQVLGDNHPYTASSLHNLGFLMQAQGDHGGSRSCRLQGLEIQRQSLNLAAAALSERQQLAMNQEVRAYLDGFLSLAGEAGVSPEDFYQQVLAWKGTVILRQRQLRQLRQDPLLAPLAAELQSVSNRLANQYSAIPDVKKLAEHRRELTELTQKKEALEVELARKSKSFRKEKDVTRWSPDQLRKSLPDATALVDFLEYQHSEPPTKNKGSGLSERRLVAFVLRKDKPIVQLNLGSVQPIAPAVEAWRKLAVRRAPFQAQDNDPSQVLRRLLWQPLEKHLAGAKTVLLSPDGVVATLPFAALPGKEAGTFLLEELTLAVVPLPRLLPSLLAEKTAPALPSLETLLLVGDIDYGAAAGKTEQVASRSAVRTGGAQRMHFEPLKETRGEILALRDSFEERFSQAKVTMLRKGAATESAVRQEAPRHRWLHLATHGFFAPPEVKSAAQTDKVEAGDLFGKEGVVGFHPGLLSGLALAGANRPPEPGQDDGILTALEVAELDLRQAELVVLSACETGLGKVAGGEGLLGLQRSFQVAGAGSVVASLWSVDDNTTRMLMEQLYDNLWKRKLPKAEALRQAQLYVLREGPRRGIMRLEGAAPPPRVSPPYYWAAFVLSGDWR
jgi:CHAT domain-containing protein/Tfp pilus assembly protein PilF